MKPKHKPPMQQRIMGHVEQLRTLAREIDGALTLRKKLI
tara:strand:- start:398 stop:514 length:117 start_codon:yes stop_codon:yes gene_type:complete